VTGQEGSNNSANGLMTFTINTGTNIFPGYTSASGTDTVNVAVPEPSEIGFVGMGLLGLIGVIRRKVSC
jgi:hypothetical protein